MRVPVIDRQRSLLGVLLGIALTGCQSDRTVASPLQAGAASHIASSATSSAIPVDSASISMGESLQLVANKTVSRGRQIKWTTSNPAIVTVDSRGLAKGVALGVATVTDASGSNSEQHVITVLVAVASMTVQPDSVNLLVGGTAQLVTTLRASDGSVITGRKVTYASAAPAIATVSASGLVAGVAAGATTVQVTQGTLSRTVPVRVSSVTPPPPPPGSGALGLNADLTSRLLYPADNPWNQPVDTAQVDANSAAIINNIGLTKAFHPDFGANYGGGPFGIPYVVVSGTQAKVPVTFDYWDESDPGPYPIPPNAPIEGGASSTGDRHVLIVDRDNWKLYELYAAYPQTNGSWTAGSGALFDLSSNALRPAGWTSADAAGLPILPGLVRYDEVSAGAINHAIRFTVSHSRKAYIPPARHWASSDTSSLRPPMGMRVRLKATVNISSYPASAQVILRALKKYGMIVADNGSDWYVSGTADARWNDNDMNTLKALHGSDFEVVKMSGVVH